METTISKNGVQYTPHLTLHYVTIIKKTKTNELLQSLTFTVFSKSCMNEQSVFSCEKDHFGNRSRVKSCFTIVRYSYHGFPYKSIVTFYCVDN